MKKIAKYLTIFLFALTINLSTAPSAEAQCPMCKMSAESNLKNGGSAGKGLNAGILYMLATPYLIVGALGLVWYRNRKRSREELEMENN